MVRSWSIWLCLLWLAGSLLASGCSLSRRVLHAYPVESVPKPNRLIERKSIWGKTTPLTVHLKPAGASPGLGGARGGVSVMLRAIHDGRAISILAVWNDPTGSIERRKWVFDAETRQYRTDTAPVEALERRTWVWNDKAKQYYLLETPTDLFAFKFRIDGSEEACMMNGEDGTYDVWEWRAGWSHISGFADDRMLTISSSKPQAGEFRVYPTRSLDKAIYLQWLEDRGELPYLTVPRPVRFKRTTMPALQANPPSGSAGDVLAEAVHEDYSWWLEVWRLLDTGNNDDYQFKGKGPHKFAIALTDGAEGQEHFTSDIISVYLD